jgi:Ser/Thr protein kinase RdoA (MazF antagonist)
MFNDILRPFDLKAQEYHIQPFGEGLINRTWKVSGIENNNEFILQQINKNVFKTPFDIAENTNKIGAYLSKHYPDYLFVSALPTNNGNFIIKHTDSEYYRLFPYVKNSVTVNTALTREEAFEAARQFAKFTNLLAGFDITGLNYTLSGFHDLTSRFEEFKRVVKTADTERLTKAKTAIESAFEHQDIAETHQSLTEDRLIPLRVVHHDTKISNILFDTDHKGLCVIDLDTVMPGYYISDVGDMMRTYLSPANEEEQDFSKIEIREDFFAAIVEGYLSEMSNNLTDAERGLFVYSGKLMIYMQAIRFLTDYLNNDVYYGSQYPGHNLIRAQNQFTLLDKYISSEDAFQQIVFSTQTQPK